MQNKMKSIPLKKLKDHPANPNRMSRSNFRALVAHIERTGRYEPIVVRPHPQEGDKYEIINGHHRRRALEKLGRDKAWCVVWDVEGAEVDLLLATLNRLSGRDDLHKRSELISRLAGRFETRQLSKLLPENRRQIERLTELADRKKPVLKLTGQAGRLAGAVVFFLTDGQKALLEEALALAAKNSLKELPTAQQKAAALMEIVKAYLNTLNGCGYETRIGCVKRGTSFHTPPIDVRRNESRNRKPLLSEVEGEKTKQMEEEGDGKGKD
jgi:ParB family chromosome partitioning protein